MNKKISNLQNAFDGTLSGIDVERAIKAVVDNPTSLKEYLLWIRDWITEKETETLAALTVGCAGLSVIPLNGQEDQLALHDVAELLIPVTEMLEKQSEAEEAKYYFSIFLTVFSRTFAAPGTSIDWVEHFRSKYRPSSPYYLSALKMLDM